MTKDLLNSLFKYDNGDLYWKATGKKAGCVHFSGYIGIRATKHNFCILAHRAIYIMFNGEIPPDHDIHHKDGNHKNNKIENLEAVDSLRHSLLQNINRKRVEKLSSGEWAVFKRVNYNTYMFTGFSEEQALEKYNAFIQDIVHGGDISKYDSFIKYRRKRNDRTEVNQKFLVENYDYLPCGNLIKKGATRPIGHLHISGYVCAKIKDTHYRVHRLVYMYHHGDIPEGLVLDHIDQNKTNNTIENLRAVSPSINNKNKSNVSMLYKRKNGYNVATKFQGVNFCKYFKESDYEEAVKFRDQILMHREDFNKVKELFNRVK